MHEPEVSGEADSDAAAAMMEDEDAGEEDAAMLLPALDSRWTLLWERTVDLRELVPLPPALSRQETADPFRRLPLNTCLWRILDAWFVEPRVYHLILDQQSREGVDVSEMAVPLREERKSNGDEASLHLRDEIGSIRRLIQLEREISDVRDMHKEEWKALRERTMTHSASVPGSERHSRETMAALEKSMLALEKGVEKEEAELAQEEEELLCRSVRLKSALRTVRRRGEHTRRAEMRSDRMRGRVKLWQGLLNAKQLSLVAELRELYPLREEDAGVRYSIRGLALPLRDLRALQEEHVSTALGYLCHLVGMLAKYLEVPLRYVPVHRASRSVMREDVIGGRAQGRYPLYYDGVDAYEFDLAVAMLRRDIEQLLSAFKIRTSDGFHPIGNLMYLFSCLLDGRLENDR